MKGIILFLLVFSSIQSIISFHIVIKNSQTPVNLLIGSTEKIRMIDPCEAYKFDTNYKQLNLRFSNITNVSRILITDKYFNDCSEESILNCSIDSNLCQSTLHVI